MKYFKHWLKKDLTLIKGLVSIFATAVLLKFCNYLLEGYISVGGAV